MMLFDELLGEPGILRGAPIASCFIPIKAQSERVNRKNHTQLCGQPLWAIAVARALRLFDSVVLDTDDEDILNHAALRAHRHRLSDGPIPISQRLTVIKRSSQLQGPEVNGNDLFRHWVEQMPTVANNLRVAQLYATSPFVEDVSIIEACTAATRLSFGAATVGYTQRDFAWQNGRRLYKGLPRSQELPGRFVESTAFYISRPRLAERTTARGATRHQVVSDPPARTYLVETPQYPDCIDINTPEDLYLAKVVAEDRLADKNSTFSRIIHALS